MVRRYRRARHRRGGGAARRISRGAADRGDRPVPRDLGDGRRPRGDVGGPRCTVPGRRLQPPVSLRWIVAHLLEETARHAGHADILRELIDGQVGR